MVLSGNWMEELIEESKTWAAASSENLFTQLCFPLSFELQIGNPVGLPSLMKREFWMKFSYLKFLLQKLNVKVLPTRSGENTEIRDDDSVAPACPDDKAELSAPSPVSLWSPLNPCTHFYPIFLMALPHLGCNPVVNSVFGYWS